jgi:hypothetical protein
MKSIFALSLLICMGTASAGKANELYVSISLTMSVFGTGNSHWTKTTYTIHGNKVVYKETYGGEIASERLPVHKEYTFAALEMKDLTWLIKEKNLLQSRSETSPPGNVPYTYYDLTEEVRWQGKRSLIKVSGPTRVLHSDAMKDSRLYQDADSLLEFVRAIVNLKGSSIRASVQHGNDPLLGAWRPFAAYGDKS